MRTILQLSEEFLNACEKNKPKEISLSASMLVNSLNRDERQVDICKMPTVLMKAMYRLTIQDDYELSDDKFSSIIMLLYYRCLKSYLLFCEEKIQDYDEIICSCKIGLILISENPEYFMYGILSSMLNYLPNYSQKYIREQFLLFGGQIKKYIINGRNTSVDSYIDSRFNQYYDLSVQYFPDSERLISIQNNNISIIKNIVDIIGLNLKEFDIEDFI